MKLLIVGFDGMDAEVVEQAEMPALHEVGDVRQVHSTYPCHTAIAWSSALCGTDTSDRVQIDGINLSVAKTLFHGAFWEHYSDGPCGMANLPFTYGPLIRLLNNGSWMVRGMAPGPKDTFCGCPGLMRGKWPLYQLGGAHGYFSSREAIGPECTKAEGQMVEVLCATAPKTDILCVGFMSPDYVGHTSYGRPELVEVYEEGDRRLRMLRDHFQPDRTIVFSDHGMMPIDECEELDYSEAWRKRGKEERGHTGGHRRYGIYAESGEADGEVEYVWDIYHRIALEWPPQAIDQQMIEARMRALGYIA